MQKKVRSWTRSFSSKVSKLNENRAKQPIKTWARACTIIPEFVGHTFEVHNGNKFLKVFVQEDMVGHKLGEFSPTRIFKGHSGKKAMAAAAAATGTAAAEQRVGRRHREECIGS